jgi:hypothetical protein
MSFSILDRCSRRLGRRPAKAVAVTLIMLYIAGGLVAGARPSHAAQGGSIKGRVAAQMPGKREPVAGAAVQLSGELLPDKKIQTVTDVDGTYDFRGLTAGDYVITVELQGFNKHEQKVSVQIEATLELDIVLQPKPVSAQVTVTDDPTEVAKTESTAPGVVTSSTLQNAPLIDQKFQDALPLLPGVVRGPDGTMNIKGTRAAQSGILVSSLNVTDPVTGNPAIELPLEAVDTIQVYSNPYAAEYGKFTGAVTSIETRSGTNTLRYLVTGVLPRPRLRDRHIYGISAATPRIAVGGPVVKDKLFFFQSLEYRFVRTNVPSLDDLNERQRDIHRESFDSFSRVDYNVNALNRLTVSFSIFPQKFDYSNLNTFNPSDTTANFHQRGWFLAVNEQATFKGGSLLQSSFSVKQFDADIFANSAAPYLITPNRNFGGWFDRQHRESRRYEWLEVFSFAPKKWLGLHALKTGINVSHTTFNGTDIASPVRITRADGTTFQLIEFSGSGALRSRQNEFSAFVQDKWSVNPRLTLDLGMRYDRDSVGRKNNFAPRFGFALLPTASERTVVRGGIGLFFDKIPLNVGAFEQYQDLVVTTFAANGTTIADGPRLFQNTAPADFKNPYSIAWSVQADHELTPRVLLRFGYEERQTRREFQLEPATAVGAGLLSLTEGRAHYREFQAVVRLRILQEHRNVFLAYVRSQARGDLNDFNTHFGNLRNPVIRPKEFGRQPFDVPNRLLFWGDFGLPYDIVATPVLDWRNGFPFSLVDAEQNFVGPRGRGRFPTFLTLDLQVTKGLSIPFRGKKYKGRAGFTVFNITNHWNPRDVQNNLASTQFGTFYNSPGRSVRLKFAFVKF